MKKIYLNMDLALTVAVTTMFSAGIVAKAETQSKAWEVHYTGKEMTSTYRKDNSIIENTMPGDTIVYSVDYYNDSDSPIEFFMSTDVIKTLEEGSKASGGAYSYKVTNTGSDVPIYDSATVGGEAGEDADAVRGLLQLNGQKDGTYFSLGTLNANEKGQVAIAIVLDGNSQNNNYMSTLGSLEIKFGAEQTNPVENKIVNHNTAVKKVVQTLSGGTNIVVIDEDKLPTTGNPRTGDSILPILICSVALILGVLLIIMYFKMENDKTKEVA